MNEDYNILAAIAEELTNSKFQHLIFTAYNYSKAGHRSLLGIHLRNGGDIIENISIDKGYLNITRVPISYSLSDPECVEQLKIPLRLLNTWVGTQRALKKHDLAYANAIIKIFTTYTLPK